MQLRPHHLLTEDFFLITTHSSTLDQSYLKIKPIKGGGGNE